MTAFKRVINDGDPLSWDSDPGFTGESDWLNKMVALGEVSEDACAQAFIDHFGDRLRYDHHVGLWFIWDHRRWYRNETRLVFDYVRRAVRKAASSQKKSRKSAGRCGFAAGVEKFCQADPRVAVTSEIWDRDPWVLGTPDGVVDLTTGERRKARREDYVSRATAVTPADTADCPRWLRFLDEATAGDTETQRFLQLWIGYCLTAFIREHALVFVYGDGGTGKTTFVNCISRLLADYAITAQMQTFTASKFDHHSQDIASLRGARLVTASESEAGRNWKEALVKQLTGGDPVRANFMRQNSFQFEPTFKLLFCGNHAPLIVNLDQAVKRRFIIVPFEVKPAQPDLELDERLEAEWPGILRWGIDGCLAWQQEGLARPPSIIDATEAYFSNQDTLASWLEECCIVDRGNPYRLESFIKLFASWVVYAKAAGEDSGSRRTFGERMRRKGFRSEQIYACNGKGFRGIELKRPKFDEDER